MATPALADGFGLARWRETWATKHPAPTLQVPHDALNLSAAAVAREHYLAVRAWEHRAWVAWAKHRDAVERAAQAQPEPSTAPQGSSSGSGTVWGWVHSMFYSYEWPTAECVVDHEGGWGAPVYNHAGSGAAGPFQWMPGTWPSVSAAAGYAGYSVLNIEANVGAAAHYVHSNHSWYPWQGFAQYFCPGW